MEMMRAVAPNLSSMKDDRCGTGKTKDIVCCSCCCSMLFEMLVLGDAESWDRTESLDFYLRLLDALASRALHTAFLQWFAKAV